MTQDSRRRTALVTGITGQDGSYLAELLLEKGYIVHGISRGVKPGSHLPQMPAALAEGGQRLFHHFCDIVDFSSVCKLIREIRPSEIYNLAAQSHVGLSFQQPELTAAASGLGVINILEAILEVDLGECVKFFEASSCEIFGTSQNHSCDEEAAMHPKTPYGKAKLLAHLAVVHYRQSHHMYACSGILFNHESPRRGEQFVTRKITMGVANIKLGKQELLALGNLDVTRDWGHARDYVSCMWLMLQQRQPADFVISTGINTTVRQFVELAFERVGMPIRWQGPKGVNERGVVAGGGQAGRTVVTISPHFFRPGEGRVSGNPSKARAKLGWQHNTTVALIVNEMVDADLAIAVRADKTLDE